MFRYRSNLQRVKRIICNVLFVTNKNFLYIVHIGMILELKLPQLQNDVRLIRS